MIERLILVIISILLTSYAGVALIFLIATLDTPLRAWNSKKWFTTVICSSLYIVIAVFSLIKIYNKLK